MPPKKPKKEGLTFLVTTNPLATSAADKRRIRSAAALKSWPERRKRTFEQFGGFAQSGSSSEVGAQEAPPSGVAGGKGKQRDSGADAPAPAQLRQSRVQHPPLSQPDLLISIPELIGDGSLAVSEAASEPCSREKTPELPCRCWKCQPERYQALSHTSRPVPRSRKRTADGNIKRTIDLTLLTPPISPAPSSPVSGMADPFNCYPVPYRPWFDGVLHHMLTVFAPRGWPALKITRDQGLKWESFMTQHALSESSLFYVRLLFATGDMIKLGILKPGVSYWIRGQAIKSINEALQDPKRATSDALILAVGRIALNESMYGDRHAANTIHRPAQQRMIQMRGGLGSLDFPELVKRLMRWSDTVMSRQGGTERFLEDDESSQNFTMTESVDVLEKWVPKEGQELRKKIKISDLVND